MKKLAIALLMISGSGLAQADYKLVSADGSELSQLCISAASSQGSVSKTAAKAGISPSEMDTVQCNDLPLESFVAKYGKSIKANAPSPAYVLKPSDESPATALCLAAASSEVEFNKVKAMYFASTPALEEEVRCNGLSLKSFARKYGNTAMILTQL